MFLQRSLSLETYIVPFSQNQFQLTRTTTERHSRYPRWISWNFHCGPR